MQKKKLLCMILCGSLLVTACTKKQENQEEPESTEPQSKALEISDLTDLDIIADRSQFILAEQDQTYNLETDMSLNGSSADNIASSGETAYFNCKGALIALPKDSEHAFVVCDEEECEHYLVRGTCSSLLAPTNVEVSGLQYYEGNLYYIVSDGGGMALYKSMINGNIRNQYAFLDERKSSLTGYVVEKQWVIHRGYIYFWSEGKGIYRMPLVNAFSTELIMAVPSDEIYPLIIKAYGSYIYFTVLTEFQEEESGYFCRYNIESGQIEEFTDIPGKLDDFVVRDGKIYYSKWSELGIYQYDVQTGENQIFLQEKNADISFYADSDYIYVPQAGSEKIGKAGDSVRILADVYTWDGTFAGTVPIGHEKFVTVGTVDEEKTEVSRRVESDMIGSDDDRIYYQDTVEEGKKLVLTYVNKSEISSDNTPIHNAGEFYLYR